MSLAQNLSLNYNYSLPLDIRHQIMRILHIANYDLRAQGAKFHSIDFKIHHALTRNGHFVYPFSYRDETRNATPFRTRTLGIGRLQKKLIEASNNLEPQLILLAHSELVKTETLRAIKKKFPYTKIAMYWVDPLWPKETRNYLISRMTIIDTLFTTTGGNLLSNLQKEFLDKFPNKKLKTTVAYFPNPVDKAVESFHAYKKTDFSVGLLFCGRGAGSSDRKTWPSMLKKILNEKFYYQGTLGKEPVMGMKYWNLILSATAGLNLSQRNDVTLYTSDRLSQLTGNGLPVITPKVPELELLFPNDSVVYVDSPEQAAKSFLELEQDFLKRKKVGELGHYYAHSRLNSTRVAKYMIDVILKDSVANDIEWKDHVFNA